MKVIIAGSRDLTLTPEEMDAVIARSEFDVSEVINGAHWQGIDKSAIEWATARDLPVRKFPADWQGKGKAAGPMRNALMAEYGEALVAIWDGESKGTANMIREAKKRGLKVHLEIVSKSVHVN